MAENEPGFGVERSLLDFGAQGCRVCYTRMSSPNPTPYTPNPEPPKPSNPKTLNPKTLNPEP